MKGHERVPTGLAAPPPPPPRVGPFCRQTLELPWGRALPAAFPDLTLLAASPQVADAEPGVSSRTKEAGRVGSQARERSAGAFCSTDPIAPGLQRLCFLRPPAE